MVMHTVELEQAEMHLADLVREACTGSEVVITQDGRPIAKLVAVTETPPNREPGTAKGLFTVPDDFDAPVDDFREYV